MNKLVAGLIVLVTLGFSGGTTHAGEGADRIDYYIELNDLFDNNTQGTLFVNPLGGGSTLPNSNMQASVNNHLESLVGGINIVVAPSPCPSPCETMIGMVGYCTEADTPAAVLQPSEYVEINLDPKLQYLTFKYDYHYWLGVTSDGGSPVAEMAAVQALSWAWQSDPNTGSTVFTGVAPPYNDPFNWDGLTPSAGLGFNSTNNSVSQADLNAATQAVYDLAVEAQNKAGDWSFSHSADGEGIYLLTDTGLPVYDEVVVFDDHGAEAVTDSTGYVAWPEGSMYAVALKAGRSFETPGVPDADGNTSQNLVVTLGEPITILNNYTPPTTTTPTPTTTPTVPETTTTVASTTTVPATTVVTTTTVPILPETGTNDTGATLVFSGIVMGLGICIGAYTRLTRKEEI